MSGIHDQHHPKRLPNCGNSFFILTSCKIQFLTSVLDWTCPGILKMNLHLDRIWKWKKPRDPGITGIGRSNYLIGCCWTWILLAYLWLFLLSYFTWKSSIIDARKIFVYKIQGQLHFPTLNIPWHAPERHPMTYAFSFLYLYTSYCNFWFSFQ